MLNIKENYEILKESANILLDYDEILSFYPTYYKDRTHLAKDRPLMELEEFYERYTNIYIDCDQFKDNYKKLREEGLSDHEATTKLLEQLDEKRVWLSDVVYDTRNSAITLLDLIDYVGNYPTTYPVPTEKELRPDMEELMDKYDISVRYFMYDDLDKMQTYGDDVVRLIETAKDRIEYFKMLKGHINDEEWMKNFVTKTKLDKLAETKEDILEQLNNFPLSSYQINGKSRREEGKTYQKRYVEDYNSCKKSQ